MPHRRRRGRTLTAVAVLAAGGALTAALLTRGDNSQAASSTETALPPNTAKVTKQTLRDTETADGELGYGTTSTAVSRANGTITYLPDTGTEFSRGETVFAVDNKPATLLYGALPAYRKLTVDSEGPDVLQLEQNLKALGYTGFTVDDEYTTNTAEAVEEWQQDRGLDETGIVELGQVLFAPGPIRVDSLAAQQGAPIGPGQQLLTYTGTKKAITVDLEAEDQRLAKRNAAVSVTLPNDKTVKGQVEKVSTVIVPAAAQNEQPTTKIEVVVAVSDQAALASWTSASVDVEFTTAERRNVLTVPVAALLALSEGGFGVEVVEGTRTRYVPVRTGLFAAGRVEISGVAAGVSVGMPK